MRRNRARRIPPNTFTIAFGLAGLAEAWRVAGKVLATPAAVPDAGDGSSTADNGGDA